MLPTCVFIHQRSDRDHISQFQYQVSNLHHKFVVCKNKLSYHAFQQIAAVDFRSSHLQNLRRLIFFFSTTYRVHSISLESFEDLGAGCIKS